MRCIDASTYNPQRPGRRSTSPNRATKTNLPGLYFLGLYWQHTRGSALLGWVKPTPSTSPHRSRAWPTPA